MHALIDADIWTYSFGSSTDDEGNPLQWPFVASRLNAQIEAVKKAVGATSSTFFLTGTGNFRVDVATIRPYKGQRPSEKPFHYQRVRDYLEKFWKAEMITDMEADDAMSIAQMEDWYHLYGSKDNEEQLKPHLNTIICSVDKDLMMVPGWHYNWIKDEKVFVDELTGLRSFYKQCLTGDTCDNIPGLHGVGPKSAAVKFIDSCDTELDMYTRVQKEYEQRFGSFWEMFLLENAALLWMVREPDHLYPQGEIYLRLENLEDERNKELTKRDAV